MIEIMVKEEEDLVQIVFNSKTYMCTRSTVQLLVDVLTSR